MMTPTWSKFLYRLAAQKHGAKQNQTVQGLTLIELLIVIIIMGILAAIASSSFLNAATKAKGSEAKVNLSAILREQQNYYMVNGQFASNLDSLGLGIQNTTNYRYRVHHGAGSDKDIHGNDISEFATAVAIPLTSVRGYMGKAWLDTVSGDISTKTVLCEGAIGETYFMDGKLYCP